MPFKDSQAHRQQLAASAALSLFVGAAAIVTDLGVNLVIGRTNTPLQSLLVSQLIGFPLIYLLIGQKMAADAARRALESSQAAREALLEQLAGALGRAESANEAKSALLAGVSHEIRTPLNGVLALSQVMALHPLPPDQAKRLAVIRQSGQSLLTLLNDLLDLSKIEAGKLSLETLAFNVGAVLDGVAAAFGELVAQKGLALIVDDQDQSKRLGDPTRLRQILDNLVSNAMKFTTEGQIVVTASRAGEALRITVADTGPGMSEEVVASLFRPFVQAGADTARHFGGTGLGLAICRNLATLMGGSITLSSRPGKGSTFTIDLPLPLSEHSLPEPDEEALLLPPDLRVLAVDDNPTNRLVLQAVLEPFGIKPVLASDGQEAVDLWRREVFDLILMDIQMPILDGLSATREIRRLESQLNRSPMPILALSADVMAHQIAAYAAAGFDGHVAKPLEIMNLARAIAAALSDGTRSPTPIA